MIDKQTLKMLKLLFTPWKLGRLCDKPEMYRDGWNDCLKEMYKRYRKLIDETEKQIKSSTGKRNN